MKYVLALALLLVGCGGGDEPLDKKSTEPVDCVAHPDLCK